MLIAELDGYLDPLYPKESQHGYRAKKLVEQKVEFYVIYYEGEPAACGGVQFIGNPDDPAESFGELKRMYVRDRFRGLGLAKQMLAHLERVAASMGAARMRLEPASTSPRPSASTKNAATSESRPSAITRPATLSACATKNGWTIPIE